MPSLLREQYADVVRRALEEDVGSGDITTQATVAADQRARGVFLAKQACVLAGLSVAFEAFTQLEPGIELKRLKEDGEHVTAGECLGEVSGLARTLLTAERTALNFLQRLCGIATLAHQFAEAAAGRIAVLDTRKTTPTLRALEKYAVAVGGGRNHRMGLFDAVLIKDNHVRLAGGVGLAMARAREHAPNMPVEVEAQTLQEVDAAVEAKADVILLDNMSLEEIRQSVEQVRGRCRIEISGGVVLEGIPALAATGADFVSVGALTHSASAIDISFEIEPL